MKKLKLRTFVVFGVAAVAAGALLHISQHVQKAEGVLSKIERSANAQEEAMGVLRAEWEYLNSPPRLERLAQDHFALEVPESESMMDGHLDKIEEVRNGLLRSVVHPDEGVQHGVRDVVAPAPRRKPVDDVKRFDALLHSGGGNE